MISIMRRDNGVMNDGYVYEQRVSIFVGTAGEHLLDPLAWSYHRALYINRNPK